MKKAKFIVLEGIDSCGKDTQAERLQEFFRQRENFEKYGEFEFVQVLDEKTQKGKSMRGVVFNKDFKWETEAECFLFWADKMEIVKKIEIAIGSGKNIIANRWELSQYAYQIHGKQREDLRGISEYMTTFIEKNVRPDLYILFDISVEESQKRKHARTQMTGKFEDYYDNAKAEFTSRVVNGYKREIQKYNHVIINGEQSKEKVFEDTLQEINKILEI
jgi:dTMP kinase